MPSLLTWLAARGRDETGASSVEYGLLATAIAAVLVVILFALGGLTTDLFSGTCSVIDGAVSSASADCG